MAPYNFRTFLWRVESSQWSVSLETTPPSPACSGSSLRGCLILLLDEMFSSRWTFTAWTATHQPDYTWGQLSLTPEEEPQLLLEQIPLDHKTLMASEQEGLGSHEAKVERKVPR